MERANDMMIPAEIWRRDASNVTKLMILDKQLESLELDREHALPDTDRTDNHFPPKISRSRLEVYKSTRTTKDLMADMLVELEGDEKGEADDEDGKNVPLEETGDQ